MIYELETLNKHTLLTYVHIVIIKIYDGTPMMLQLAH